MSLLVVPNTFANGTGPSSIIDATQMNANFTAVATAVNNIYPSQILPITTGQATFGATATGVGYKFLANDATAVPLTVSGVSGQTVDLFDVTLTSGGTKAFSISSAGVGAFSNALTVGTTFQAAGITSTGQMIADTYLTVGGSGGSTATGDITAGRSSTTGLYAFGTTAANFIDFGITNAGLYTLTGGGLKLASGGLTVPASILGASIAVNGAIAATAGQVVLNESGGNMFLDCFSATGTWNFRNNASTSVANINDVGVYTATSDARLKENFSPVPYGLEAVLKMQPIAYDWKKNKEPGLGFRAQDMRSIVPEAVRIVDKDDDTLGITDAYLTAVIVRAIQQLTAEVRRGTFHPG